MITIIDYQAGNIKSIQNMLRKVGVLSKIASKPEDIKDANKLILSGVGHFDHGMRNIKASGLLDVLNKKVILEKVPLLGICLGAQLLGDSSEEGVEKGLGWIPMRNVLFDKNRLGDSLKVPHMGWNSIKQNTNSYKNSISLIGELEEETRFYFVHSFHMVPEKEENILATSYYGYEFVSAVQHHNIFGVQFHPEKSHVFGMRLLENFAKL